MRRLSLWMRAHPVIGDSLIAALIGLLDLASWWNTGSWSPVEYLLEGILLIGPLVFRRYQPLLMCYLILAGGFIQLFNQFTSSLLLHHTQLVRPADLALGVALYTMVVYVGRRQSSWYAVWLAIGTAGWEIWQVRDSNLIPISLVLVVSIFGFCWAMGEFVGARRAYQTELEQRLRLLETERDQQARIAVADERTRIARELHDVVAHAVSVMVVQADGAGYALRTDPDMAQTALATISDTGRQALAELRRLLGLLRDTGQGQQTELLPQPDITALAALVAQVRASGLPVELTMRGELANLPAGIGLSVYRIVQEALTNSLKHAGVAAAASVTISREGNHVIVEVTDDGRGAPGELSTVSGGNGLIGMRERAVVLGGTLEAGPGPGGGWRVTAVLPIGPDSPA